MSKEGTIMTAEKQSALQTIEENASLITGIADKIWGFAELSLRNLSQPKPTAKPWKKRD